MDSAPRKLLAHQTAPPGPADAIDRAIFQLMDFGVEAAWSKFERAFMNGTIQHRISREEWSPPEPGSMQVLGKLFVLDTQILCDSPNRIAEAKALLIAIREQAAADPNRLVFVAALRRCLGIWIFITAQSPAMRTHLRGVIKALAAAGVWDHANKRFVRTNLSAAWQMGQAAYNGAATLRAADQSSIDHWLTEWQALPLGERTALPKIADAQFDALMEGIDKNNNRAFMARRSPTDADSEIWIHNDSAGKSDEEPDSYRGCGAWAHAPRLPTIIWYQEQWCKDILEVSHSTAQEAANGLANLRAVLEEYSSWCNVVHEVYDSAAVVDVWRGMASHSFEVRKLVQARHDLLAEYPHVRVLSYWQDRDKGFVADDVSKNQMQAVRSALAIRFPGVPLDANPTPRAPNLINNAQAAASWVNKADELFDQ